MFRRQHADCVRLNAEGVRRLEALVADSELPPSRWAEEVRRVAGRHRVTEEQRQAALAEGWRSSVAASLRAGEFGREEEKRLGALLGEFGLSRREVDTGGLWTQVAKGRRRAAEWRIGELVEEAISVARGAGPEEGPGDADPRTAIALAAIDDLMLTAAAEGELSSSERRDALIAGFEAEMDRLVRGGLVTADHERALETVFLHFRFDDDEHGKLNRNGVHERFVQALVLHDLSEGVARQRQHLDEEGGDLPFRLKKSETLLWLFQNVEYGTTEIDRDVLLDPDFDGFTYGDLDEGMLHPEDEETTVGDTGLLGVTTRRVYFAGSDLHFRIPHGRIVTLEPRADGIGLTRDRPEARPEYFLLDDADFAYELLQGAPSGVVPSSSRPTAGLQKKRSAKTPRFGPTGSVGGTTHAKSSRKGQVAGGEEPGEDGCADGCGKGCGMGCVVVIGLGLLLLVQLFAL